MLSFYALGSLMNFLKGDIKVFGKSLKVFQMEAMLKE
jgi:hypothetical protein